MRTINMLEAKSKLFSLVEAVETGVEAEIIIARNGRPVARLVPLKAAKQGQRIGVAKGAFVVPETIDAADEQIEQLFDGTGS